MNGEYLETIVSILKRRKTNEDIYAYLYKYFVTTLKNIKIQLIIDSTVTKRLKLRAQTVLEEINDNSKDYSLPEYMSEEEKILESENIKRITDKIRRNSIDEYETLEIIKQSLSELKQIIYKKVLEELGSGAVEIKDNNIKQDCIRNLEGISINGECLIIDGKINEKAYNQILTILDTDLMIEIETLIKLKNEKRKMYYEIETNLKLIENLSQILEALTREVIEQELEKIDENLLEIILKDEYMNEHVELLMHGHFKEHSVSIGENIPEYVKKFPDEIRIQIEYRCKLQRILNTIPDKKNTEVLKSLPIYEKQELQTRIKEFLKQTTEESEYIKALKESMEDYIYEKKQEMMNLERKIEETIEPVEEAIKSKKTEKIRPLYDMGDIGLMIPLESILIYRLLIDIEKNDNIEFYKKLIHIILNDEIEIFDEEELKKITSIINDEFDEYFYNTKKKHSTIDNRK